MWSRAALGAILLLALAARAFYAYGLPLNGDEFGHLELARQISLRPESFYLPLGSPGTTHPLGVLYLTALADWAGGGQVLVIRMVFIGLSLLGLVGLYLAGTTLFGSRGAWIALALAATDRHLVALAPVFLESPSVIFLAPWTILVMYRCLVRGKRREWLLLGLLFGLGYWFSTVFLAMWLPFGLYVLLTGRLGEVLKCRWMYAGLAVMLALMLPNAIWNLLNEAINYERHVDKVGLIGLSPRMALLYVGDLLICLKDPSWIAQHAYGKIYPPICVPCNWVMGLVYLVLTFMSARYWQDERVLLPLLVMVGFLLAVTLLDAREPWNEFTWASSTVFAAILLSGFMLDRLLTGWRRVAVVSAVLAYALGALLWFLSGPQWGYFCPQWERAYVGRILSIVSQLRSDPEFAEDRAVAEIRGLTDEVLARHGDSAVAWYFRARYAETLSERGEAVGRALQLDPTNRLVIQLLARELVGAGDLIRAKGLLERMLAEDPDAAGGEEYELLAEVEFRLGDLDSAAAYARKVVASKPEDRVPYRALFFIYDAMGDQANADGALEDYLARHAFGRAAGYLSIARRFWKQQASDKGRILLERAIEAHPRRAEDHALIGSLLMNELNDVERAIEHLEAAVRLGSTDPKTYCDLGRLMEEKGEVTQAVKYYQRALQLDPEFSEARSRLGTLADQTELGP